MSSTVERQSGRQQQLAASETVWADVAFSAGIASEAGPPSRNSDFGARPGVIVLPPRRIGGPAWLNTPEGEENIGGMANLINAIKSSP